MKKYLILVLLFLLLAATPAHAQTATPFPGLWIGEPNYHYLTLGEYDNWYLSLNPRDWGVVEGSFVSEGDALVGIVFEVIDPDAPAGYEQYLTNGNQHDYYSFGTNSRGLHTPLVTNDWGFGGTGVYAMLLNNELGSISGIDGVVEEQFGYVDIGVDWFTDAKDVDFDDTFYYKFFAAWRNAGDPTYSSGWTNIKVYPVYFGNVPSPTATPTITPTSPSETNTPGAPTAFPTLPVTATHEACDTWEVWPLGPALEEGILYSYFPPYSQAVELYNDSSFASSIMFVNSENVYDFVAYDLQAIDELSQGVYCSGDCNSWEWWVLPDYCFLSGDPGGQLAWSDLGDNGSYNLETTSISCIAPVLPAFDLSDFPTIAVIATTFNLEVPVWGWLESTWEICFHLKSFEYLRVGNIDLLPYATVMIHMLNLQMILWLKDR